MLEQDALAQEVSASSRARAGSIWARRTRHRWIAFVVVGVVAGLTVMVFGPSDAVATAGAHSYYDKTGGMFFIGMPGMIDRPITVLALWPNANADTQVFLCHPTAREGTLSSGPADAVGEFCQDLEPVRRGMRLQPNPPQGDAREYLIARIDTDAASDPVVEFCGLRMLYRTGLRVAYKSNAGSTDVVWGASHDGVDGERLCD